MKHSQEFSTWNGFFYMTLSCLFKSAFSILTKLTMVHSSQLSSFHILAFRSYFMLVISACLLAYDGKRYCSTTSRAYFLISIRSILAILSMSCLIYSLRILNISDVYTVYYCYPIIVIFLSSFFLAEKLTIRNIICLAVCLVSTLLIIKPTFIFGFVGNSAKNSTFLFGFVFMASVMKAIEDVVLKSVGTEAHFLLTPMLYSVIGFGLFPFPLFWQDDPLPNITTKEIALISVIAVFTFLYQAFMALAIQSDNVSKVSLVNYLQVALMFVADVSIFGKPFMLADFAGSVLIIAVNLTK